MHRRSDDLRCWDHSCPPLAHDSELLNGVSRRSDEIVIDLMYSLLLDCFIANKISRSGILLPNPDRCPTPRKSEPTPNSPTKKSRKNGTVIEDQAIHPLPYYTTHQELDRSRPGPQRQTGTYRNFTTLEISSQKGVLDRDSLACYRSGYV